MLDAVSNQEKISRLKEMLRNTAQPNKQPSKEVFTLNKTASRKPQSSLLPLEQRYLELEEKFNHRLSQEWRQLESVALEIETLQEEARNLRKEVDRNKENIIQRAGALERQIAEQVAEQCEEVRTVRKDLMEGLEKKYRTIKTETMALLGSQFEAGWDETRDGILGEIEDVRNKMEHEEAARDEIVTFMVTNFGEEILKAEQMVQKERQERAESHKRLMTAIERVEEQVTNAILLERKESGAAILNLEGYLEELCFKIQSNLLG